MRVRNIVFLVSALTVTALLVLTARSEQRLQESLRRVQEVQEAAGSSSPNVDTPRGDSGNAGRSDDETIAAWQDLLQRVTQWLGSTGYDTFPIPPLYVRNHDHLPPSPAAPEDLIMEIRHMVECGGPTECLGIGARWEPWSDHLKWSDHLNLMRTCAVLLAEHAKAMLEEANYGEAAADILAAMKLADLLAEKPLQEAHRTRCDIYGSLQAYLQVRVLPEEFSAQVMDQLAHADGRSNLRAAIADELRRNLAMYEAWKEIEYRSVVNEAGLYWGTRNWLWAQGVCRPWFNLDQECYADTTARMLEVADAPFHTVALQLREIETDVEQIPTPNQAVHANLRWTFSLFADQAFHEAHLDIMQMGLLLEQHYARYGFYPPSLDAISPGVGGSLPVDPFNGQPYHYELDETGFILYAEGLGDGSGPAWRGQGAPEPEAAAAEPVVDSGSE